MGELRKDYILDRWVVISSKRGKRPHQLDRPAPVKKPQTCFFCPGNENLTPPEIGRIPDNGGWRVRWFENKFPAETPGGRWQPETHNRFFTFADSYGYHEVIVETARHDKQLAQLPVEDIEGVLHVYARRIIALEKKQHVAYVNVFKNHGPNAGTSVVHSHSQIIAGAILPPGIQEKLFAMRRFVECPYCRIVEVEKSSHRRCFENEHFAAFTPYASRFNYEIWIFPKKHVSRLEDVDFSALASILSKVLKRLDSAKFDYNLLVQYGPKGVDFHFHIEICPRVSLWGGFELGSEIVINTVSPENAARFYRGEE